MNTLNEKAINIFKAVVAETLLQNTYEERFLYGQLESFWNNCRQLLSDGQSWEKRSNAKRVTFLMLVSLKTKSMTFVLMQHSQECRTK